MSSLKITLYYVGAAGSPAETRQLTAAEFKTYVGGSDQFNMINMAQEGIGSIISPMHVSIYPVASDEADSPQEYMVSITGGGLFAKRRVVRGDIYKTLLDGYGLWSLP